MKESTNPYKRHRFPPAIIQYALWLYHRFNLSHRDIEDVLAERRSKRGESITISVGHTARSETRRRTSS